MRRLRFGLALALASAVLAACATAPRPLPPVPGHVPSERPRPPARQPERRLSLADLPGWAEEDHAAALRVFQAGCTAAREAAAQRLCRRARALGPLDERAARRFFETSFEPQAVGEGLLTAYFQPEYEARLAPGGEFTAPVRPRPAAVAPTPRAVPAAADPLGAQLQDLLGEPSAAPVLDAGADRAAIEAAPLSRPAPAWMRPEDLFFMQIQGSGVLDLPDGRRLRAVFAASNGKPFVGLARVMRQGGLAADGDTSQEAIHAWLAAHRGPEADALMRRNPRYVFFKVEPDDGSEPAGAAGVPLPAGRALAMDASRHGMGELYWIDASAPSLPGAFPSYRRLAMALDVGGAIKGEARADLYIGRGAAAGREAGRVRHVLRLYRLVPRDPDEMASRR
jgi:membrane-bound lytic murein transglycosylase A